MAINMVKVHQRLQAMSNRYAISEGDLFKCAVVQSEEPGDYDDFISAMELEIKMNTVDCRIHDGDVWYRGQGN